MVAAGSKYTGWIITTVAGSGTQGYAGDDGPASKACLNSPFDVTFDAAGHLFFSDTLNHRIRRIDAGTGWISTVAGTGEAGWSGDGGPATRAAFNQPYGVTVGGEGTIYVADRLNGRVRRIDGRTGIVTTLSGTGEKSFSGDGGPADRAGMVEPNAVALSRDGRRLYIADVADNRVRVIDLSRGTIATFAGNGEARHGGDGGPAPMAGVFGARAVVEAADGTVYIMERQGSSIRAVDPRTGIIRTVASSGEKGYAGDGGPAQAAVFDRPKEMTLDGDDNLLVVDTENHAIRLIDWQTDTVSTIAGNGKQGYTGDGVSAVRSSLGRPHGVAIGPDGSFYIGDTENHRIRRVAPPS